MDNAGHISKPRTLVHQWGAWLLLLLLFSTLVPQGLIHTHHHHEETHNEDCLNTDPCHLQAFHNVTAAETTCRHSQHILPVEDTCELCQYLSSRTQPVYTQEQKSPATIYYTSLEKGFAVINGEYTISLTTPFNKGPPSYM